MVGAIVLAAGSSRRFGGDKRAAKLPSGQTVLEASISRVRSVIDQVLVVLRHDDQAFAEYLRETTESANIQFYCAPDSASGMGGSLANAINEVGDWSGAMVFLGDMPFIRQETIELLKAEFIHRCTSIAPIVVPMNQQMNQQLNQQRRGHPVTFHQRYFGDIAQLKGDQGARAVISAEQDSVIELAVDDPGILADIDLPQDLTKNLT